MKKIIILLTLTILFAQEDKALSAVAEYLKDTDIPKSYLEKVFSAPGITIREKVMERFASPYEKQPYAKYRKLFLTDKRINGGVKFYTSNQSLVDSVAKQFKVDPFVLISIVGVESNYGRYHSQYTVFNSLYTAIHHMPRRLKWSTKELGELLKICYANDIDPHSIKGSYAGAFGYGQFIPSSFNHYAVDFDGDGVRHHLEWPDVLGSVANYLRKNGYKAGDERFEKGSSIYKSIFAYNHSDNYVGVILELRREIKGKFNS